MADLFVLGFPTKEKAEAVMEVSRDLQKQELLDLEDAALVWRTAEGKIKVQQGYSPVAAGAASGALWGMLFGLIFLVPLLGAAIGAATGAIAGSLTDVGIDDSFIKSARDKITPGTSALFLMSSDVVTDKVKAAFEEGGEFKPELIQSNLSNEQEAALREMIAN